MPNKTVNNGRGRRSCRNVNTARMNAHKYIVRTTLANPLTSGKPNVHEISERNRRKMKKMIAPRRSFT